ncbi:hypothetical protein H5410_008005 [Solanum commersonii]|uniref:Uncharacterized protein n=1 Tax=Solanum commersonii TaxID=4109 RepID=A0A9J6AEH7_SOLCO|nr:hypothetical protein H5410_008005 [Solanum commersonii]
MGLTQDFGVNARSIPKSRETEEAKYIQELKSKKNNDSMALQQVINAINIITSYEVVSGSLDLDKSEESHVFV